MQRASLIALVLATWGIAGGVAQAQEIGVSVQSFGGRTTGFDLTALSTTSGNPIGLAECDSTITFRFSNIDTSRTSLQFFHGGSCNDPDVRTDTTSIACLELTVPSVPIEGNLQRDVEIRAGDLVPCDTAEANVRTIWVLALNNETDTTTAAGQQVDFPIAYDFAAPTAPGGFTASGGETTAQLGWTTVDGISEYEVFLDETGCTDGSVTSPGLTAEPPDEALIVDSVAGTATSYSLAFPASVPIGSEVAVAIRAIDRAGNVGPLSTPVCVDRFEVTSWWDTYCGGGDGGTATGPCAGDGCAAAPGRGSSGGLAMMFAAGVLLLVARRRTK